jgi:hypothetical protein
MVPVGLDARQRVPASQRRSTETPLHRFKARFKPRRFVFLLAKQWRVWSSLALNWRTLCISIGSAYASERKKYFNNSSRNASMNKTQQPKFVL